MNFTPTRRQEKRTHTYSNDIEKYQEHPAGIQLVKIDQIRTGVLLRVKKKSSISEF